MTIYTGDSGNNTFVFEQFELRSGDTVNGRGGFDTITFHTPGGSSIFSLLGVTIKWIERIAVDMPASGSATLLLPQGLIYGGAMPEIDARQVVGSVNLVGLIEQSGTFTAPTFDFLASNLGGTISFTLQFADGFSGTLIANPDLPVSNNLRGNSGADILIGSSAGDHLNGGGGADQMRGGAGDDTYVVDSAGDTILELAGDGKDTVSSSIDYTLGANLENLHLLVGGRVGRGNALDNLILGSSQTGTVLYGEGGKDTILGSLGNDRLNGGPGHDQLRGSNGDDTILGGSGNDKLFGENGNDTLLGGAGNDWLDGAAGRDIYTGGTGADIFLFTSRDSSRLTGATADRITDFSALEGDVIDLRQIDANQNSTGDDAFTFIKGRGFSGTAGELRYVTRTDYRLVLGDTDGDGVADFAIRIDGVDPLKASDFLL